VCRSSSSSSSSRQYQQQQQQHVLVAWLVAWEQLAAKGTVQTPQLCSVLLSSHSNKAKDDCQQQLDKACAVEDQQ
jgi:hypothetical protein